MAIVSDGRPNLFAAPVPSTAREPIDAAAALRYELLMATLDTIYRTSLSLLTDLYQLTMAHGYFKSGMAEREAVFHLFFRKNPFGGGFAVAAGLEQVVDFLGNLAFADDDLAYLGSLQGNDGEPLFGADFLEYLKTLTFSCDVDAIPEGTVTFPHQPLVRVRGPLLQAQLIETALLNLVNFQTLVATKAARVTVAAGGDAVLEFGLRRAQGIDGALTASRAAYVGGCAATSNVLAGKLFGIPVRGTHAHSWVMAFDDEDAAFEAYAAAMPNNCVFLVDTYDTLAGVDAAIRAGRKLRERGFEMAGVRLDSGDLAYLSVEARKKLDDAGFPDALIVASNDLSETVIESLKQQGATIAVWGVGTKLVTAYDQPALGGVYKLAALRDADGQWEPKVKLSEQLIKVSTPGVLQVRRFVDDNGVFLGDVIFDELAGLPKPCVVVDPSDATRRKVFTPATTSRELLEPVLRAGRQVRPHEPLDTIRERAQREQAGLHAGIRRLLNPHTYPVGLEAGLFAEKQRLVLAARGHEVDV